MAYGGADRFISSSKANCDFAQPVREVFASDGPVSDLAGFGGQMVSFACFVDNEG